MNKLKKRFEIEKPILVWLYESNSTESIAKMFSFGAETVRKKLKALDIPRRKSGRVNSRPSKKELQKIYPKNNLRDTGVHFGVGETTAHTWVTSYGIEKTKKPRQPRTEEHKENLSKSQKGRVYPDR